MANKARFGVLEGRLVVCIPRLPFACFHSQQILSPCTICTSQLSKQTIGDFFRRYSCILTCGQSMKSMIQVISGVEAGEWGAVVPQQVSEDLRKERQSQPRGADKKSGHYPAVLVDECHCRAAVQKDMNGSQTL